MMQQYVLLKEQYSDCILFFRLGDFYEMFFDDAVTASRELEITLTSRDCGLAERAPMCGVPYHSVDGYVARLIERGYKVAICEQMTDPKATKGLVERDVVRVVTAGTLIEPKMLEEKKNNFILSVYAEGDRAGLCWADISTGEMLVAELREAHAELPVEWARIAPTEALVNALCAQEVAGRGLPGMITLRPDGDYELKNAKDVLRKRLGHPLSAYGCERMHFAIRAAGALLNYLRETQKSEIVSIASLTVYRRNGHMALDPVARRNLELTETIRGRARRGSLLWLLDKTCTAMGARQLRSWIEQPLSDIEKIDGRLDAVAELKNEPVLAEHLREYLKNVYDIERLLTRVSYGAISPRECLSLKNSLQQAPAIQALIGHLKAPALRSVIESLDPLDDVTGLLAEAITDDPPIVIREGGIFRSGYDEELDETREVSQNGRQWLERLEANERESTGIKTLKVAYNKVFGYYIEVTRANLHLVPYRYQRKQTIANGERFITEDLKRIEEALLGAEERAMRLEYQLFVELRETLTREIPRMQRTAGALKQLDAFLSLAQVAYDNGYCRPELHDGYDLYIEQGRHPVVERLSEEQFVPNDALLSEDKRLAIITGPNMAGKSTYMRQVALIVLMAHIGSFVPAHSAKIPLTDAIFTRVGASDDLASGQSTFMVEMKEMAGILERATNKSLLILDEIGRGTSTFDGLSIAWATVEHIANKKKLGAKTLFATHYHELTELEGVLEGTVNYFVDCKELGEDIIFLRQVKLGGADRSYGVHVAALAGLPHALVARAREILAKLEVNDVSRQSISGNILQQATPKGGQVSLQDYDAIELAQEIAQADINAMTPMDALNKLYLWRERAKKI
jgi:DNA mismatch repair protein MutS